jgi:hypothetical protein
MIAQPERKADELAAKSAVCSVNRSRGYRIIGGTDPVPDSSALCAWGNSFFLCVLNRFGIEAATAEGETT